MDIVVHIRKAVKEDCDVIVALGKRTFMETYSEMSNSAAVQEYIEKRLSAEKIAEELDNPKACFYIGFVNGVPVAFTRMRYDRVAKGLPGKSAIEIERIYVLKEYQGFKVGREMMEKCRHVAMREKFDILWLQVWQHNHKAIQFYQKAGFVVYETAIFSYGKDMEQDDFLMRLDLYY
ncbi:MAG TPA: GNAT family N-acetyltransferase [Agriterribacter sp.]|nr:GNAT family N-acetyltransferase [Agriterribacter sp.]HRQ51524.1 GNAT family N-acetyltransferase [Agriterribacter sp.]